MARIYDNIELKFTDGLKNMVSTQGVNRVDFCVGYFNLRGWNLVINEVDNLEGDYVDEGDERVFRHCRLLIGMQRPHEDLIKQFYSVTSQEMVDNQKKLQCKMEIARNFRKQLLLGLPTKQDEATLRRLATQLKSRKVVVKLYLREPLHAKLYIGYCPSNTMNPITALMGSSNLTFAGLTGNGELNAVFSDEDQNVKFSQWFDKRWNDRTNVDITDELAKVIDESWAGERTIPPYYIYLKTAYHLSEEARSGIKEFTLPIEFRHDLFDFQQTAVKIAARYLYSDKRGGAMIGDVVGLGKTITACAIAKIFEMNHSSSTLIICPANLVEMWQKYRNRYDLKADIISMAKPIDIDSSRFYRLIIVDESHNLRNSSGKRYQNIKALIEHLGCKVLLLTATPYNKDYSDLSSQLKLFLSEDDDLGIRPENYVASLGGDRAFLQKHSEVHIRSIKAFEKSNSPDDWMDLMKMFLVRRTRTFIKNNYAKEDARGKYLEFNDGRKSYFPDRVPKALKFKTESGDQYSRLYSDEMVAMMENLQLPRYGLSHYEDTKKTATASQGEKQLLENLSRAGQRMMGFCKSTFFKRMDSSGFSFLLTLYRHILRNAVFIYAIENKLPLPIGDENSLPDEFIEDGDMNDLFSDDNENGDKEIDIPTDMKIYMAKARDYYNLLLTKNNVRWIDYSYFKRTLKTNLNKDCAQLIEMILLCGKWNPQADQKLNMLEQLLNGQHGNDKVLIFTQYSDTANYIYRQLKKRGMKHIDRVTGGMMNPTATVERFSPLSNNANVSATEELRVLVATDVLSEGQNLQDSHIVVNFDLPWAIIRLIQRAGRVDRIGQEAKEIFCYSFFPADGVENVINLRGRLNARINENASIVGSDEIFFEGNAQNLRDMYNEKSGSLDEDDDDVDVDLGSQAYQIWKNATDANPELKTIIPQLSNIIYSTKKAVSPVEDGVITYAKTHNDFDVLTWYDSKGEIISQSQRRILQSLACTADEPALLPLDNHLELVGKAVNNIQADNISVSGILGSRFSTRYKVIELMEHFYNQQTPSLFLQGDRKQQLKMALDMVYNYQLLESSKNLLGRLLRMRNNSNEDIIDTILDLFENGNLCRVDENNNQKEPSIICSMGLKYE